jgi:CO/xanthine dehydrogenase FAD-binding subunit
MVNEYIPRTLQDALEYINSHQSILIAGGTDLMVQRRNWANVPASFTKDVVYISNLKELQTMKTINDELHIGAGVVVSDIIQHKDCPKLLEEAINISASPALRNLATIAGNIGNASPAGDTLPVLYILNALIEISSIHSKQIVPIEKVITGPRKTILQPNQIITKIIIPLKKSTQSTFQKVGGRRADAISKVSMAASAVIEDEKFTTFKVAFGAVGPTVVRRKELEEKIQQMTIKEIKNNINQILEMYQPYITPIDDQRSNKKYRSKVALNLLEDFIKSL